MAFIFAPDSQATGERKASGKSYFAEIIFSENTCAAWPDGFVLLAFNQTHHMQNTESMKTENQVAYESRLKAITPKGQRPSRKLRSLAGYANAVEIMSSPMSRIAPWTR